MSNNCYVFVDTILKIINDAKEKKEEMRCKQRSRFRVINGKKNMSKL